MLRPDDDWSRTLLRSLALAPERVTDIASWHRHVPFAFALVALLRPRVLVELGTHKGDSYCAFCQAVREFATGTRCHAVDTWAGDEHAGLYGPEVLTELRAHHDPRYGEFSRLLQMRFDEAIAQFEDGYRQINNHDYDLVAEAHRT